MTSESLIAGRLGFKGRLPVIAIAVSFLVMIAAVAISSGFRKEIRKGIAAMSGDIIISEGDSMSRWEGWTQIIGMIDGVEDVRPAIYRPGVVKKGDLIQGITVKGVQTADSSMCVRIPRSLARTLSLEEGDVMQTYFIGERTKVRNFRICGIYENLVDTDDNMIVYAPLDDIRRLNGWSGNEISALEIIVRDKYRSREGIRGKVEETACLTGTVPVSAMERYARIFDWLDLIDFNVLAILALMTLVAGFNMISGLLIMLFRNVSTIGILKSLGMTDRSIAAVFIRVAARTVAVGMLAGNAAALLFCVLQQKTHIIKLNPENYFVSFVPADINVPFIAAADIISFATIILLLTIPTLFIAKVDPAQTVKSE